MKKLIVVFVVFLAGIIAIWTAACGGGGGGGGNSTPAVLAENVRVLDESTTQYLTSVSPDGNSYTFSESTEELNELQVGDIISSAPTSAAPYGFLRKIVSISSPSPSTGDASAAGIGTIIETEAATLEDAIASGKIEWTKNITPDDVTQDVVIYDADGDFATEDDQIKGNATVHLDVDLYFNCDIENGIKKVEFSATGNESASIDITGDVDVVDFAKEVDLLPPFHPVGTFTVTLPTVPPLPVTFTPELTFVAGVTGTVSSGVRASSGTPGGDIIVGDSVKNIGSCSSDWFRVGIYLSTNSTISPSDTLISDRYVGSLAAGATSNPSARSIMIPSNTAPG